MAMFNSKLLNYQRVPHFEDTPTWKDTINLGDILRSDQQSSGKLLFESLFRGAETSLKKSCRLTLVPVPHYNDTK